jgi:hypothetical protein
MSILRSVLAVIVGAIVGGVVTFIVELPGIFLYPPPEGVDYQDAAAMTAWMKTLPAQAMALVLAAWTIGAFAGAFTAAKIARSGKMVVAVIVSLISLAAAAYYIQAYEHPSWMWVSVALLPLAGLLGGTLARGRAAGR